MAKQKKITDWSATRSGACLTIKGQLDGHEVAITGIEKIYGPRKTALGNNTAILARSKGGDLFELAGE